LASIERERENSLIEEILAGRREKFALLVEAYKIPIFNLALRMTGNVEEAYDLSQDTFLKAYKNLGKYRREKPFFTYLYTIALNTIRNARKREKVRHRGEEAVSKEGQASDPEQDLLKKEEKKKLQIALLSLPEEDRACVILKFYQGLTFEEIADIFGMSLSAVKMRTYRALKRLKESVEE